MFHTLLVHLARGDLKKLSLLKKSLQEGETPLLVRSERGVLPQGAPQKRKRILEQQMREVDVPHPGRAAEAVARLQEQIHVNRKVKPKEVLKRVLGVDRDYYPPYAMRVVEDGWVRLLDLPVKREHNDVSVEVEEDLKLVSEGMVLAQFSVASLEKFLVQQVGMMIAVRAEEEANIITFTQMQIAWGVSVSGFFNSLKGESRVSSLKGVASLWVRDDLSQLYKQVMSIT